MKLEEHIETEKRIAKEFLDRSQSTRVGAVVSHMYEDMYRTHIERADLLEELKTLRKAFDLACWELGENRGDTTSWRDDILEEVKKDNENKA